MLFKNFFNYLEKCKSYRNSVSDIKIFPFSPQHLSRLLLFAQLFSELGSRCGQHHTQVSTYWPTLNKIGMVVNGRSQLCCSHGAIHGHPEWQTNMAKLTHIILQLLIANANKHIFRTCSELISTCWCWCSFTADTRPPVQVKSQCNKIKLCKKYQTNYTSFHSVKYVHIYLKYSQEILIYDIMYYIILYTILHYNSSFYYKLTSS
jgi:hypothetical protein